VADIRSNYGEKEKTEIIYDHSLDKKDLIEQLTGEMKAAAANLEFEKAAALRDEIARLNNLK
jgi:excinuclease UvrABC helicase subunit UvrB